MRLRVGTGSCRGEPTDPLGFECAGLVCTGVRDTEDTGAEPLGPWIYDGPEGGVVIEALDGTSDGGISFGSSGEWTTGLTEGTKVGQWN